MCASLAPADDILGSLQAAGKIVASDVVSGHCMHPACLEASLERSLESLGLEAVDLFYVHNPAESQLRQLGKAAFMQVCNVLCLNGVRRGCGCQLRVHKL